MRAMQRRPSSGGTEWSHGEAQIMGESRTMAKRGVEPSAQPHSRWMSQTASLAPIRERPVAVKKGRKPFTMLFRVPFDYFWWHASIVPQDAGNAFLFDADCGMCVPH